MKNMKSIAITIVMMLALCACKKETEVSQDLSENISQEVVEEKTTSAKLSDAELDAINEDFNDINNVNCRVFVSSEFDSEKEIEEIKETVKYIEENFETESKSITGSYEVVSGEKDGDKYTVRVEVTDGDNWSEIVFPPRDVTFTKDGDTYKFISNLFDWAVGSNKDKSYSVDLSKYDGAIDCYVYEYSDDQSPSTLIEQGESFVYVVYNGKLATRISDHPDKITTEEADAIIEESLQY